MVDSTDVAPKDVWITKPKRKRQTVLWPTTTAIGNAKPVEKKRISKLLSMPEMAPLPVKIALSTGGEASHNKEQESINIIIKDDDDDDGQAVLATNLKNARLMEDTSSLLCYDIKTFLWNQMSTIFVSGKQANNHCGYCAGHSSESFYIHAFTLAPSAYQGLLDHSWRRSGRTVYRPGNTCCCYYTIRLNTMEYLLSKSSRKIIKGLSGTPAASVTSTTTAISKPTTSPAPELSLPAKPTFETPVSTSPIGLAQNTDLIANATTLDILVNTIKSAESKALLHVILEKSCFSNESFQLYKKYQSIIHHDPPEKLTKESYINFLIDTPLTYTVANGITYGSFHQKYYLQSKLVAVAVLDILPQCLSSVYFFYDPDYKHLCFGSYSALREIAYTKMLSFANEELKYYYMGFYIHTCPKMAYKARHRPSELLCPSTLTYIAADIAIPKIEAANGFLLSLLDEQVEQPTHAAITPKNCRIALSADTQRDSKLIQEKFGMVKEFYLLAGIDQQSLFDIIL